MLTRVSVCESVRKRCVDMGLADNVHTGKCVALIFLPFGMIFDVTVTVTVTDINIKDHLYQFCPLHSSAHVYYMYVLPGTTVVVNIICIKTIKHNFIYCTHHFTLHTRSINPICFAAKSFMISVDPPPICMTFTSRYKRSTLCPLT